MPTEKWGEHWKIRLTFSVHAALFWCFHNPPHSDMDYTGSLNAYEIFWHIICIIYIYTHTGDLSPCRVWTFMVCTEFDSWETSGQERSLAHSGHPSIWWSGLMVLNFGFWEWVLFLCATDFTEWVSPTSCPTLTSFRKISLDKKKYPWFKNHIIQRGRNSTHYVM